MYFRNNELSHDLNDASKRTQKSVPRTTTYPMVNSLYNGHEIVNEDPNNFYKSATSLSCSKENRYSDEEADDPYSPNFSCDHTSRLIP